MKKLIVYLFLVLSPAMIVRGQDSSLDSLLFSQDPGLIRGVNAGGFIISFAQPVPLASFLLNQKQYATAGPDAGWKEKITVVWKEGKLVFSNISRDTLVLSNPVPFGIAADHVYITGLGDNGLSRTHLFLPGKAPVGVIVPDNAWDLGYCTVPVPAYTGGQTETASATKTDRQVTALLRRDRKSLQKGRQGRFEVTLYPGGSIQYKWYTSLTSGDWRGALTEVFQHKMLYDTSNFDDALFHRKDLQWVRNTYVLHMMMTWDKFYYDYENHAFHLDKFLENGRKWYGGDDILAIWPTWPTLGLDQRNQFDLFRDLPGGTRQIRTLSDFCHRNGTKLFVCYNPWDEGTHHENHFSGLSRLIAETATDGVVLDTKGSSSKELQDAADKVRKGVIMYSEGMAVPKDMAGIVSGRVHNALYYPPFLNLNKLIKPEFAIYRVAELYKERIQREFAISFFNGYGTEINIMPPGQPDWAEEQYKYLGRTSRILRENTWNFVSRGYSPLIGTTADSIWVNQWERPEKTIYTIYSIRPAGYKGYLFETTPADSIHFVDLWHHLLLEPRQREGKWWLPAYTHAFDSSYLGTNNEGEVDCIARLPRRLRAGLDGDKLTIQVALPVSADQQPPTDRDTTGKAFSLRIWAGDPDYSKEPLALPTISQRHQLMLHDHFGRFEGKFVIQLMKDGILLDETIVEVNPGTPRRISHSIPTTASASPRQASASSGRASALSRQVGTAPSGMVVIPAGNFTFKESHGDEFIPYPRQDVDSSFAMSSFLMDKFPVTNADFKKFIVATRYQPSDTVHYLKHWVKGQIPRGMENFPVVNISYEDAQAYAKWAGKRLPTELEWQYAAQTPSLNEWPWLQTTPVTRTEEVVTESLTVKVINGIDPSRCNLGNDSLYAVGKYPAGANPYGLQDLVGCVWQITNDLYMSGSYRYIMLKGGSYFRPSGSWWYVQGGPRELNYRQFLLRVNQGFERNATVGFRCVKDLPSNPTTAQIGIIKDHVNATELSAMEKVLQEKGLTYKAITWAQVHDLPALEKFKDLWVHRTDTTVFEEEEVKAGTLVKEYVRHGGKLFVSMEAMPLLHSWGIESNPLELRQDSVLDEGFGRPLGFHAFRSHPVFDGLQGGGAYFSKQKVDHTVRKWGFFGQAQPAEGKVIGIQWTYITFTEQNKLLLEYALGKGKVVAAGSYLYYAADNYNHVHLARLTENIFRYMEDSIKGVKKYFWSTTPRTVAAADFAGATFPLTPAEKWVLPVPSLQLPAKKGSNAFYDLVGRRIAWMGKMNNGVEEIWTHPFMALRDLSIGVRLKGDDSISWLKNQMASVIVTPEYLVRSYQCRNTTLREIYTVSFGEPCGVAHIEMDGNEVEEVAVRYASNLRYMWPYSPEASGNIRFGFDKGANGHILSGQDNELCTAVLYSERPSRQTCTPIADSGQVDIRADFTLAGKNAFNIYIVGDATSWQKTLQLYGRMREEMSHLFLRSGRYYTSLLKDHLNFSTPDSAFNEGYRWALARTDQFLQTTPEVGTALMAGFGTTARGWNGRQTISGRPGYAWYFGRDGEWSALAIDAYGDFGMVKKMLETLIRYQDVNGKIYHELSSSGAVHYDASDATPLFLILAAHYLKYSGDRDFIRQHWEAVQRALDFCYSTDTDGDGLIENTNVGHGWIEGGRLYGSHTEFYLAACWAAALEGAAYMADNTGQQASAAKLKLDARRVRQIIDRDFWNPKEQFFYNGKMKDGSYMQDPTVLAAVAVYLNTVTDSTKSQKINERMAGSAFSTDWGIRIIEDSNVNYKPGSYHAGMVWPLYAGWAALSEFRTGNNKSGYQHIMNNLLNYRNWSPGSIEETFNGDRYLPNGVCSHQCWSEAMVLLPAIEGMLGLEVDALEGKNKLAPYFPWDWKVTKVNNIPMSKGKATLEMNRQPGETSYRISSIGALTLQFQPAFPLDTHITAVELNGARIPFTTRTFAEGIRLRTDILTIPGNNTLLVRHSGGVGALPAIAHPVPGAMSSGIKILKEGWNGNNYALTGEGRSGDTCRTKVFHTGKIKRAEHADIVSDKEGIVTLQISLPAAVVAGQKYTQQEVRLYFE